MGHIAALQIVALHSKMDVNRNQNRLRYMTVCWMLPCPIPWEAAQMAGNER
jgi:hypothetical protein